ncbi:hypothetical protein E2C01_060893 [Portunus trituberculatus]|uniref:Uncharacterized protein n=1 Tax=Portunus trituberculatus TaxID=210409 RepID=A0A5B7H2E8_PORTR|nr:hypothetical protein [Portunus trituberculatus]
MLHHFLSFIAIFMLTVLLILLTACLPSCSLAAQVFLLPLIPLLSYSQMQMLTSILKHSYLSLVNSGTPCLLLYLHLPYNLTFFKMEVLRHLSLNFE